MNELSPELLKEVGRTTLALAIAAVATGVLLRSARISSSTVHRAGWLLVLVIGWSFLRFSVTVPWYQASTVEVMAISDATMPPNLIDNIPSSTAEWPRELVVEVPRVPELDNPEVPSVDLALDDARFIVVDDAAASADAAPDLEFPLPASAPFLMGDNAVPEPDVRRLAEAPQTPQDVDGARRVFSPATRSTLASIVLLAWTSGIIGLAAAWIVGYVRFVRRLPVGQAAEDDWRAEWHALLSAAGASRPIPLRVTADTGPMLCRLPRGFELLVPGPLWRELNTRERACILRHELAHYVRGDVWSSLTVHVLALPHWFNPMAWWAVRRFDEAAEWACDRAAAGDEPATAYARTLLRLGEAAGRHASYSPAVRGRTLASRIRRVLGRQPHEDSQWKKLVFGVVAACLAATALVRVDLVAREPSGEEPQPAVAPAEPTSAIEIREIEANDNSANGRRAVDVLRELGALPSLVVTEAGEEPRDPTQAARPLPMGLLRLAEEAAETIRLTPKELTARGLRIAIAKPGLAQKLKLAGRIDLDPDSMVRVKTPFPGNVVSIAPAGVAKGAKPRTISIGNRVGKGQTLATVWSKDFGESKSELLDALARLRLEEDASKALKKAENGAVPQRALREAERQVDEAKRVVSKAERTLRSWQVSDEELTRLKAAATHEKDKAEKDPSQDANWGRADIVSPIDGTILERNVNAGDVVDPTADLFKIADLSQVRILARVYEEDLPKLRSVPENERRWTVQPRREPLPEPLSGMFEISNTIDATDHTATVLGSLENPDGQLTLGDFVTATVDIPANSTLVVLPGTAVVEHENAATIFVKVNGEANTFHRRKIALVERSANGVAVKSEPNEAERAAGREGVQVGEKLLALAPVSEPSEASTAPVKGDEPANQPANRGADVEAPRDAIDKRTEPKEATQSLPQSPLIQRLDAPVASDGEALAYIQVLRRQGDDERSTSSDQAEFARIKRNVVEILKSKMLLSRVLRKQAIAELPLVQKQPDPLHWLQNSVFLKYPVDGELLQITIRGNDTEQTTAILNALIDTFFQEVVEKGRIEREKKEQTLQRIKKEKTAALESERQRLHALELVVEEVDRDLHKIELEKQASPRVGRVGSSETEASPQRTAPQETTGNDGTVADATSKTADVAVPSHGLPLPAFARDKGNQLTSTQNDNLGQQPQPSAAPTRTSLRYDGRSFDEWVAVLETDLSEERKVEAISALEAFARHGFSQEAVTKILGAVRDHDAPSRDATQALMRIGRRSLDVLPSLETMAETETNEGIRGTIREVLSKIRAQAPPAGGPTSGKGASEDAEKLTRDLQQKEQKLRKLFNENNERLIAEMKDVQNLQRALGIIDPAAAAQQNTLLQGQLNANSQSIFALQSQLLDLEAEIDQHKLNIELAEDPAGREARAEEEIVKDDRFQKLEAQLGEVEDILDDATLQAIDDKALAELKQKRSHLEDRLHVRRDELLKRFVDSNEAVRARGLRGTLGLAERRRDRLRAQLAELKEQNAEITQKLLVVTRDTAELENKRSKVRVLQQVVEEINRDLHLISLERQKPRGRQPDETDEDYESRAAADRERKTRTLKKLYQQTNDALIDERKDVEALQKSLGIIDPADATQQNQMLQHQSGTISNAIFSHTSQLSNLDVDIDRYKLEIELLRDADAKRVQADEESHKDEKLRKLEAQLGNLDVAIKDAKRQVKGTDNPTIKRLEKDRGTLTDQINTRRDEILKRFSDATEAIKVKEFQGKLQVAQKHRDAVAARIEDLKKEQGEIQEHLKVLTRDTAELETKRQKIHALELVTEEINRNLQKLELDGSH